MGAPRSHAPELPAPGPSVRVPRVSEAPWAPGPLQTPGDHSPQAVSGHQAASFLPGLGVGSGSCPEQPALAHLDEAGAVQGTGLVWGKLEVWAQSGPSPALGHSQSWPCSPTERGAPGRPLPGGQGALRTSKWGDVFQRPPTQPASVRALPCPGRRPTGRPPTCRCLAHVWPLLMLSRLGLV